MGAGSIKRNFYMSLLLAKRGLQTTLDCFNIFGRVFVILGIYGLFMKDTVLTIFRTREVVDGELARSCGIKSFVELVKSSTVTCRKGLIRLTRPCNFSFNTQEILAGFQTHVSHFSPVLAPRAAKVKTILKWVFVRKDVVKIDGCVRNNKKLTCE